MSKNSKTILTFPDRVATDMRGVINRLQVSTPRTDDLYDLFPRHDLDLSGKIDS